MQESIHLCEQPKNRWGMGTAYRYLGLASITEGQNREAQSHLRKSLDTFGQDFVGWDIARSLAYMGDAAFMSGDISEVRGHYREALCLSTKVNALPIALDALPVWEEAQTHMVQGIGEERFQDLLDHLSSITELARE